MAWTTPTSRAYDYTVTESDWNTDVVDNLIYLKSKADRRIVVFQIISPTASLTTGDSKNRLSLPLDLNGANVVDSDAVVFNVSSSGTPTLAIRRIRGVGGGVTSNDIMSTSITIDANERSSYTAATPPVINGSYDDVETADIYIFDVDAAGTGATGLDWHGAFLLS